MISILTYTKSLIIGHRKAILYAVFVGTLFIAPQILARVDLGNAYRGAPFLYQNDDESYLASIEDIIEGHLTASSPIYYGYKDSPAVVLPFGEYLYAIPAIVLHLPVLLIVAMSKFIFPAILLLLVYSLVFLLVRESDEEDAKLNAIAGGSLVVLGYDLIDPTHVLAILHGVSYAGYSSVWARLVNPISGALFLFALLIMLWLLFNKKNRFLPYVSGILVAAMTGYFFSFAMALSITGLLLLVTIFQKKMDTAWSLIKVISIGILPFAFAALSTIMRAHAVGGGDTLTKIGLFYTHVPLFNKFLLLALAMFLLVSLWVFFKKPALFKNNSLWWWYCFALLVGAFMVFVQQMVTGMAIWPQHFVQYSIPIVYMVGSVVLYKFLRPWSRKVWIICVYIILIITSVYGVLVVNSYKGNMVAYQNDQRYVPIYAWLNTASSKDGCVVLVIEYPNYLSGKIPAYTHCDDYYSAQNYYGVPQDRVEYGYFMWLRLRGISADEIMSYLNNNRVEVRTTSFTNWLELWRTSEDPWLKSIRNEGELTVWEDNATAHLAGAYKRFVAGDLTTELKKYKLDYVVWDRVRYPAWNSQDFPFLEEVYKANGLVVFRVKL